MAFLLSRTIMLITCVKPNVTRAEAVRLFRGGARELRRGPLRGVMDFYIPYRLYRVEIVNGGKTTAKLLAIDAAMGLLDLYEFDHLPGADDCAPCLAERLAPALLTEDCARAILEEKVKRAAYLKGFFRVKDLTARASFAQDLRLPYWVGLYGADGKIKIEVIDALRRSFEGNKLREIVVAWFQSPAYDSSL